MFDGVTAVDISGRAGLVAMGLFTLNVLLGLLVSVNYNTVKQWPRRKLPVPLYKLHNWNAYVALVVGGLHPAILMFSSTAHFRVIDLLWPVNSPEQSPLSACHCLSRTRSWSGSRTARWSRP